MFEDKANILVQGDRFTVSFNTCVWEKMKMFLMLWKSYSPPPSHHCMTTPHTARLHHCLVRGWLRFGVSNSILQEEPLYTKETNVSGKSPLFQLCGMWWGLMGVVMGWTYWHFVCMVVGAVMGLYFESFWPEWYILTIYHFRDIPFWSEMLSLYCACC